MRRFQRVYSLILHSSILNEWEKIWEISFSSSLDEQTIKSAIIEFYFESSLGIERGEQKKHIRVGRMQSRQPVRHENCYSRAGTGTGAHKLRIRCFTCHIPANHHISVRSSCHVHTQRITSRARLIRTREFRTRAIEYFAGAGHVLSTISHATLSANHLPLIASFFAPKIINYH